jgi:transcription-repair coupling factor (superfamily II helicase)
MRRFVNGDINVLVSTMIVESGLDVPNANTMIVHQAQNFGLAQLYQLRGRVGRGHRRAYCYLIVPDNIHPDGERRLKVLEHHTELGSGYRIALRDLELRGAGNLLGAEQSGYAHAVGFDLFLRWLNETVQAMKGENRVEEPPAPEVILDSPAYLPDSYVPARRTEGSIRAVTGTGKPNAGRVRASGAGCQAGTRDDYRPWRQCAFAISSWGSAASNAAFGCDGRGPVRR